MKIGIYYANHVLLVVLMLMGKFKNVFKILIMQIPSCDRTLHLTKDVNDQMVGFDVQANGES